MVPTCWPSTGSVVAAPAPERPITSRPRPRTVLGLRHVAFKIDDIHSVVGRVRAAGWDTVAEIVDFEGTFLLCYVRGPKA